MLFRATETGLVPHPRDADTYASEYETGRVYRMDRVEPRSTASHNHFFALVTEAWQTLPEHLSERFTSPEHLRKHALIKAGFCDIRTQVVASNAEARRVAAFIRPMDEYAIVTADEATVTVYTAQSQSTRAMGRKAFQESKDSVLRVIAEMTGIDPGHYGRSA